MVTNNEFAEIAYCLALTNYQNIGTYPKRILELSMPNKPAYKELELRVIENAKKMIIDDENTSKVGTKTTFDIVKQIRGNTHRRNGSG